MATPRELGVSYEIEALRLSTQVPSFASRMSVDLRQRIGTLADDLVAATMTPLGAWKLPFLGTRAEELGDEVKAAAGVNPLDVDDGQAGGPGIPADLYGQALTIGGQVASSATLSGQSQTGAEVVQSAAGAIGDGLLSTVRSVRNIIYFALAVVALVAIAYAYGQGRRA
ncbi:MAG TPA: hypothetical protein VF814_04615 [Casimicrobiaceae bacterium]